MQPAGFATDKGAHLSCSQRALRFLRVLIVLTKPFYFIAQPTVEFEEVEILLECDVTENSRDGNRHETEQRYQEILIENTKEFNESSGKLRKIITDLADALTAANKLCDKDIQQYRISGNPLVI